LAKTPTTLPKEPKNSCPQKALFYITKNSLIDVFPNVFVSLRILLTLPVSVASGVRSFSKLIETNKITLHSLSHKKKHAHRK
jgi:hypothetical protein